MKKIKSIFKNIMIGIFIFLMKVFKIKKDILCLIFNGEGRVSCLSDENSYLKETGWWNSYIAKVPIGPDNEPLPWVTHSFIDFISDRLNKNMDIFEYGSGYSTFFYSKKVKSVTSVEHAREWHDKLKNKLPKNINLIYQESVSDATYCMLAASSGKKFDMIIVDGFFRVNCIKNSYKALEDDGVVILDDSERVEYQEGVRFLEQSCFKHIDFWGISPGFFNRMCTTVFYKDNNCLGI